MSWFITNQVSAAKSDTPQGCWRSGSERAAPAGELVVMTRVDSSRNGYRVGTRLRGLWGWGHGPGGPPAERAVRSRNRASVTGP